MSFFCLYYRREEVLPTSNLCIYYRLLFSNFQNQAYIQHVECRIPQKNVVMTMCRLACMRIESFTQPLVSVNNMCKLDTFYIMYKLLSD